MECNQPVHPGPVLDPPYVTLGLSSAVHGDVTDSAVDVPVRLGLQRVPRPVASRDRVHGSLSVHLHLLLQLLDPLQLGDPLVVRPAGYVGLERLLTGHGEVTHLAPRWLGLGGMIGLLRLH